MNVDDVMATEERKPTPRKRYRSCWCATVRTASWCLASSLKRLHHLTRCGRRDVERLPSVAAIMSSAYEQACREAGGVGSVHAVETEGGATAVRELVATLLAS
jgi:hypothetical protein